ncbi:MAG: hypothetical protein E6R08_10395 [Nevskiaceae bacterium]|uniref:Tyr recombinase domain-containing protein n=1 Tax=Ricinus communis TaxID=3988 RepID=B9TEI2_RICCO|nr:conserved hypothetical protein [Ricinus communis]TXG96023.1 MAG: hypothetical protein E6R08_10395 [Nevskiaceae bacterium]
MPIELIWPKGCAVPVPLINGLYLHNHLSGFLVTRYYQPRSIRDNMTPVTTGSLRQISYDLKAFLDALEHNGVDYPDADFTDHIEKVVEAQLGNSSPTTYNTRMTRIRDFYDYLRKQGVRIKAIFPARTVKRLYQNQNENFLSHTNHRNFKTYEKDDSHKRTTCKDDYLSEVISMDQYGRLYEALNSIDVVYAVIAQVMMQTLLRVADVCELPLHKNTWNKYLPLWPEFERQGKDHLKLWVLSKGLKKYEIPIYAETWRDIYSDYIQPFYHQRKELFENVYLKRSNATLEFGNTRNEGRRNCPEDILWLTATGCPVKPYMVEKAFRSANLGIHPHMLRHTGATHLLRNYCRLHNIEDVDVRMASQFLELLQGFMGHCDIETTRKYTRTIAMIKNGKSMPHIIPSNKKVIDERLAAHLGKDISGEMEAFFSASIASIEEK